MGWAWWGGVGWDRTFGKIPANERTLSFLKASAASASPYVPHGGWGSLTEQRLREVVSIQQPHWQCFHGDAYRLAFDEYFKSVRKRKGRSA